MQLQPKEHDDMENVEIEAKGSAIIKVASSTLGSTAVSIFVDVVVELTNTVNSSNTSTNAVNSATNTLTNIEMAMPPIR